MEKNIIGRWGADLNDREYARAVAALGVLEATGTNQHAPSSDPDVLRDALAEEFDRGGLTAVWRDAYNIVTTWEAWQNHWHKDAAALSQAWQLYLESTWHQPRFMPRLAVWAAWHERPDLVDLDNLFDVLSYSGARSLSLQPADGYSRETRADWHWPVRVGVPAGTDGERLMERFQAAGDHGTNWVAQLAHVVKVGVVRDDCDLLILPPGWAERLASRPSVRLRASFVVCLDDPLSWSETARNSVLDETRKKMGAVGIAQVGHPDRLDPEYWYRELIRELSHDVPLHAALREAGRRAGAVSNVLGFSGDLDRLRILSVAERLDRQWASLLFDSDALASDLEPKLADKVREGEFHHESESGLPIANDFAEREMNLESNRQPRWIQAAIARPESGDFSASVLAPERPNPVAVFIGPSIMERTDQPFPDREFDFNDGPIPLQVQFELANASITAFSSTPLSDLRHIGFTVGEIFSQHPQDFGEYAPEPFVEERPLVEVATDSIMLPAIGKSQPAYFIVWPQTGAVKVSGRIVIIHNNRIVQTAMFEANVGLDETQPARPLLQAKQALLPRLQDAPQKRGFDMTITVSDSVSWLNLTINRDGKAKSSSLGDITGEISAIQNTIYNVTYRDKRLQIITEDETVGEVLYSLAANGAIMYNILSEKFPGMIDKPAADNGELRIELMPFTERYFPLEYVYSGPSPEVDAVVCPNAVAALRQGSCSDCPNQNSTDYVCPNHFWGWKHVIQRRASQPPSDEDERDVTGPTRTPFGSFAPIVFAASSRAFNFNGGDIERGTLLAALRDLGILLQNEIDDWKQWDKLVVSKPTVKLLVLLPHTDKNRGVEVLEIGVNQFLGKNKIKPGIFGPVDTPKLLIAIGCTVAQVTETFAPYHGLFQMAGANVIITSLARILGRDAVPIATEIVNQLKSRSVTGDEIALGELMRDIRRQMLADGYSGVLGILCFGDADWIFGG
jgi:hypothetical protein